MGFGENTFRRWTDSELQARCDKGLCYRCDEPFSKGHRCKNKELHLYLVANDLEDTKMEYVEHEDAMVKDGCGIIHEFSGGTDNSRYVQN